MKKLLLLLFCSSLAHAEFLNELKTGFGAGADARLERHPSTDELTHSGVPTLFLQSTWRTFQLQLEVQYLSDSSSEGDYRIENKRWEGLLLGRKLFPLHEQWALYAGLGAGTAKEWVTTSITGSKEESAGDMESIFAAEAGGQFKFWKKFFTHLSVRGLKLQNLDPIVMALALRLGMSF